MNLLPKTSGSRPRLACEISTGGVVAGRSPEPELPLSAVARAELPAHAILPGLRPGNLADRVAVIGALRRVLEQVGGRSNGRNAELTLVIPDAAVRVLLLDFDALPGKLSEALPIVRFRLKKLVPFDPDQAMVSFQIMSTSRAAVRVLAVAIPRDVLSEYESVAREAGFEPGAVLPSTLAALAALDEGEGASLVVNAHAEGVTTAIVRAGILLLHRAVDLAELSAPAPGLLSPAFFDSTTPAGEAGLFTMADRESTQAEWAAQQPLPEYGRNPYADRIAAEAATQDQDALPGSALPPRVLQGAEREADANSKTQGVPGSQGAPGSHGGFDMYAGEAAPAGHSPYASATLQQELDAQFHSAAYVAPSAEEALAPPNAAEGVTGGMNPLPRAALRPEDNREPPTHSLAPDVQAEEIGRAISVAMAYFEDSLSAVPELLLSAGPLGADTLNRILREQGLVAEDGVRVREMVNTEDLAQSAITQSVPRGWLAGVTGALRS